MSNLSANFNINIANLPTDAIGEGEVDNNKAFAFTIMYYNSSLIIPTGTIKIDGGSNFSAVWQGGGAPNASSLQINML